jgi:hypothetical protein
MWGTRGDAPGQFLAPVRIFVDNEGHAYVWDIELGRTTKFQLLPPLAPEA